MGSFRCPYLVRHGQFERKKKEIVFKNECALKLKAIPEEEKDKIIKTAKNARSCHKTSCNMHPLKQSDDYLHCTTHKESFLPSEEKRDVIPTKEPEYTNHLKSSSILDLEIL